MMLPARTKAGMVAVAMLVLTLCFVFTGWFSFPSLVHLKVSQAKDLNRDYAYNMWKKLPVPVEFKVYFFNVTNPDEILLGEDPVVKEVGPYVYEEWIERVLVDENHTSYNTIEFFNKRRFIFSQDKSGSLSDTDVVTVLNAHLMAMAITLERSLPFGLDLLEEALPIFFPGQNLLFLQDEVRKLLFEGIELLCNETNAAFCHGLSLKPAKTLKKNEVTGNFIISFLGYKNDSLEGPFKMFKGGHHIDEIGTVITYQNNSELPFWPPNTTCSQLKGSDSTIFPPFMSKDSIIHVFSTDICRTVESRYSSDVVYKDYKAVKFVTSESNFDNISENECYCFREDQNDPESEPECPPKGVFEATPCQGGPVLISPPHFYQGDSALREAVHGLEPQREKHETFMYLDLLTGTPLVGWKRVQINSQLKPVDGISILENVTSAVFPVMWMEEGLELNETTLTPLSRLYLLITVLDIVKWLALVAGGVGCAVASGLYFHYRRPPKQVPPVFFNKQPSSFEAAFSPASTDVSVIGAMYGTGPSPAKRITQA